MKEAILQQKQGIVEDIKTKFETCKSAVLIDYRGLTVEEVTNLRNKFREAGVEYRVLKNTMIRRAVDALGMEGLEPVLEGPTAVAFGMEDAVAPAKIISDFIKETEKTEIKAGVLEGKVVDVAAVKALASLPSREVLLAKVLGQHERAHHGICYGVVWQHPQPAVCFECHWRKKERISHCA